MKNKNNKYDKKLVSVLIDTRYLKKLDELIEETDGTGIYSSRAAAIRSVLYPYLKRKEKKREANKI